MNKQNLKKVIAMAVISTGIFALAPTGVSAAWRQNSIGWWNSEGNSYSKGWRNIGGSQYFFDNNGYMKTGWLNNGGWYYLSPSGAMQTGWIQDGGYWYYLKSNGAMATGIITTDGKVSNFDGSGKWLGYVNNNQNTNNTQQTNGTNNSSNQGNANSNTVSNSTVANTNSNQQTNVTNNSSNQGNTNSNAVTNSTQANTNNTQQTNVTNNSNNQRNANSNSSNTNRNTNTNQNSNNINTNNTKNQNLNNNQTTISNQTTREFTIDDAIKMITEYKGVPVTLTPPGPRSGINDAYEKMHKDGKVGYYISSYLFGGRRVDNSGGILIFEDGSYKQYKQGHHPSDLASDEWTKEKNLYDAALKDFLNHGQPHPQDGSSTHYYNGVTYNFGFMQGLESRTFYRNFHGQDFDRDGNYIETSNDYLETANIRNS